MNPLLPRVSPQNSSPLQKKQYRNSHERAPINAHPKVYIPPLQQRGSSRSYEPLKNTPVYGFNIGSSPLAGLNEYKRRSNLHLPQAISPTAYINRISPSHSSQDYGFPNIYSNSPGPLKHKKFFEQSSPEIPYDIVNYDKKIFIPGGLEASQKGQAHYILPHFQGHMKNAEDLDVFISQDDKSKSKRSKERINESDDEEEEKPKKSKKKERKKSSDERKSPKNKDKDKEKEKGKDKGKKKRNHKKTSALDTEPNNNKNIENVALQALLQTAILGTKLNEERLNSLEKEMEKIGSPLRKSHEDFDSYRLQEYPDYPDEITSHRLNPYSRFNHHPLTTASYSSQNNKYHALSNYLKSTRELTSLLLKKPLVFDSSKEYLSRQTGSRDSNISYDEKPNYSLSPTGYSSGRVQFPTETDRIQEESQMDELSVTNRYNSYRHQMKNSPLDVNNKRSPLKNYHRYKGQRSFKHNSFKNLKIICWAALYPILLGNLVYKKVTYQKLTFSKWFSKASYAQIGIFQAFIQKYMSEPMEHVFNEKRNLQLFEIKDGSSETEQRCRVVCQHATDLLEGLIVTLERHEMPSSFLDFLVSFTQENCFIPQDYLSSFELNRLELSGQGTLHSATPDCSRLLLGGFVILRAFLCQILLRPWLTFSYLKEEDVDIINLLTIGSVIYHAFMEIFADSNKILPQNQKGLQSKDRTKPVRKRMTATDYEINSETDDINDEGIIEGFFNKRALSCLIQEHYSWFSKIKFPAGKLLDILYEITKKAKTSHSIKKREIKKRYF